MNRSSSATADRLSQRARLALSVTTGAGEHVLAVSLSSTGVLAVLFGLALRPLGHLWSVARAVAAKNARFV